MQEEQCLHLVLYVDYYFGYLFHNQTVTKMNHNFLPYEVCELLPQINPYSQSHCWATVDYGIGWEGESQNTPTLNILSLTLQKSKNDNFISSGESLLKWKRDAWTILDVLTWLEDEHKISIQVTVGKEGHSNFTYWYQIIRLEKMQALDNDWFYDTRIDAYTEGIKYALNNLIR